MRLELAKQSAAVAVWETPEIVVESNMKVNSSMHGHKSKQTETWKDREQPLQARREQLVQADKVTGGLHPEHETEVIRADLNTALDHCLFADDKVKQISS